MIRGMEGMEAYLASLAEIHRILKAGGILGLAEPMHFDVPVPDDLVPHVRNNLWEACFATLAETEAAIQRAGFSVLASGYCEDADAWWNEFVTHAPAYDAVPDDTFVIRNNNKRWLSFGYVIAVKP